MARKPNQQKQTLPPFDEVRGARDRSEFFMNFNAVELASLVVDGAPLPEQLELVKQRFARARDAFLVADAAYEDWWVCYRSLSFPVSEGS
ncbi:hypothetical protein [Vogesella mureinivorans]|uniref:hypothetical protein n=1 Tax=Vogesella mureinivorans TaxID=657276 RepID=UPI0011C9476B|nr:hypothetical protein [Vogesella mureinivorans]